MSAMRHGRPNLYGSDGPHMSRWHRTRSRWYPTATRSTCRLRASSTPSPEPCCASRDVELAFLGLIRQRVTATQLLYRTTNMSGEPEAAVTTVIVPAERSPHRPCPMVSYQCAIDAVSARCFPSYAMRRRSHALGALAQLEYLLVAAAIAEGWAVSVPDHEGTDGIWGTPHEPGYRVLDGIRAALGYERARPVPRRPGGAVGVLRRRAGHRLGRRGVR